MELERPVSAGDNINPPAREGQFFDCLAENITHLSHPTGMQYYLHA